MNKDVIRCWNTKNPLYIKYHDEEWGVPIHDDHKLFEFLVLGGFQAGLTWELILNRRKAFRKAFDNFYPEIVQGYSEEKLFQLMKDSTIIRNRTKILSTINNASKLLKIQNEFGTFDKFIWKFVNNKTIQNSIIDISKMPCESKEAISMSKELKKRGMKFVGPKICYAFMQTVGMVNDHLVNCFRHIQIKEIKK